MAEVAIAITVATIDYSYWSSEVVKSIKALD